MNSSTFAYTNVPQPTSINSPYTTLFRSFTLTVSDGTATDSKGFTVNLTGVNDTPVLSASVTSTTFTDTAGADTFTAGTGTLTTVGRDAGQTQTYGVSGGAGGTSREGDDSSTAGKSSAVGFGVLEKKEILKESEWKRNRRRFAHFQRSAVRFPKHHDRWRIQQPTRANR